MHKNFKPHPIQYKLPLIIQFTDSTIASLLSDWQHNNDAF